VPGGGPRNAVELVGEDLGVHACVEDRDGDVASARQQGVQLIRLGDRDGRIAGLTQLGGDLVRRDIYSTIVDPTTSLDPFFASNPFPEVDV